MKKILLLFVSVMTAAVLFAQSEPTVSASSVTFKYCATTKASETVTYIVPYTWHTDNSVVITEYGTSVHTIMNARGCDSIITLTLKDPRLPGEFTVNSSGKKVRFSCGNLQYCAAPASGPTTHKVRGGGTAQGIWRFAEHQYDIIGSANTNRSSSYSGWIDLFGANQTGYNTTYNTRYPWNTTGEYNGGNIPNTDYDWGYYNEISNGGAPASGWFTMLADEWVYMFDTRTDATNKRSYGRVGSVDGVILLPDNWTLPAGCSFTANQTSVIAANTYTISQWEKMEQAGAVFLPKAGRQQNNYYDSTYGAYWTGTGSSSLSYMYFYYSGFYRNQGMGQSDLCSVRLVCVSN